MVRVVLIKNKDNYRGYTIKNKYTYNKKQLDKIIDSLEYYSQPQFKNDRYMAFSLNIFIHNQHGFNIQKVRNILTPNKFYYRWTREYKNNFKEGEHYHLMVIANNINKNICYGLKEKLDGIGVSRVFFAPRLLEHNNFEKVYFHYLNEDKKSINGLNDAVTRYSYYSKVDQKSTEKNRSFDGSNRYKVLEASKTYSMRNRIVMQTYPSQRRTLII